MPLADRQALPDGQVMCVPYYLAVPNYYIHRLSESAKDDWCSHTFQGTVF